MDQEIPKANITLDFKITPEEREYLLQLQASGAWKIYRKILSEHVIRYLWSAMPIKDPYELKEKMGQASGLNLSINLLDLILKSTTKDKDVSGQS
jgi:hypothetical protein